MPNQYDVAARGSCKMGTLRCLVAVAAFLGLCGNAAAWTFEADSDPTTGHATAVIGSWDRNDTRNGWMLIFQCFDNMPEQTAIILSTTENFNSAATYPAALSAEITIDYGQPIALQLKPINSSGKLSFMQRQKYDQRVNQIVLKVGKAKRQIGMLVSNSVYSFAATGSSKSVRRFLSRCHLPSE